MINRNRLSSILAVAALSMAAPIVIDVSEDRQPREPKPRDRPPEPTPAVAVETDADRQRIRRAQQKRERQIARQSKGMQAQGGL